LLLNATVMAVSTALATVFILAMAAASVPSAEHRQIWVHPSSSSSAAATGSRLSLQDAVAAAAAAEPAAATTIHLAAGHHRLGAPLRLDRRHSGTRFVGHGEVVVSGGVTIPVGPRHDGGQNVSSWSIAGDAKCRGCGPHIWKAAIPAGADSRQFYVNGVRANRTWVALPPGSFKAPTASAVSVPGAAMLGWKHNQSAIELVYRGGVSAGSQWQESRCPVASITNGSSLLDAPAGTCAADYCAATMCPECCGPQYKNNHCSCAGTGGLVNATPGAYKPSSVVCPKERPICVGYNYNQNWGVCQAAGAAGGNGSTTTIYVAQPCAWNGNIKIGGTQPLRM
jgi:hypothetical protein